jgi:general secretion pathway protein G
MVVIAILGILITLVATNVGSKVDESRQTRAQAGCSEIKQALEDYRIKHGKLPNSIEDLLQPDPKNNDLPYIEDADRLKDPWENLYVLKQDGKRYQVVSYGADGQPGGEGFDADIGGSGKLSGDKAGP